MSDSALPVLAERRGHIGHLTLNRPAGLNALTLEMVRLLRSQLEQWAEDTDVHAVVLRGAGERAFCAGGDIRGIYEQHLAGEPNIDTFFEEEYALDAYLHAHPKPVLALMDGFVLGGGMGLAQGASIRVITERSRLGMPETGIGYFPDVGGSYFLPRLPGEIGLYLGITGNHLRSADALYAGLADLCLHSDQLNELDRLLDAFDGTQSNLHDQIAALAQCPLPEPELRALQPAIDTHFAQPDIGAIRASLATETRPDFADWAAATISVIDSRSPIAMAVTLELLRRGRHMSLTDCFAMELHLDRLWFDGGDIMEGVRALLVDKDKQPKWNPAHIDQLDSQRIAAFFADL
ncbi:enoyl-CoA hydratase/isomerase family protein [Pseudomonas neustonica]|uniref:enoyl-CoA hydratase/isomerase family protein n=1 Tax=Pseudomonas neustonica TaxID=2487346 RepID=UPI003F48A626